MPRKGWLAGILILLGIGVALAAAYLGGKWLSAYILPAKPTPTEKKDLVNIFVLIAAGIVGTLTALAALGNLIISRRNLEHARATFGQQRDLDQQRAQETALQAYLEQMTQLVREGLIVKEPRDPLRLLARGQTLSLFWQLDPKRKRALLQILHEASLIGQGTRVIGLSGANLKGAYLRELDLKDAALNGADMKGANLEIADLSGADLSGADLSGANLRDADLSRTDLTKAEVTKEQLKRARSLNGATMPDSQKYQD